MVGVVRWGGRSEKEIIGLDFRLRGKDGGWCFGFGWFGVFILELISGDGGAYFFGGVG